MSSSSESPVRSPQIQQKPKPNKIFVTNLAIEVEPEKLQAALSDKFSKYGKLDSVVVKKSYNNKYSFAFIQYKEGDDASSAVHDLNNTSLYGQKIKVELQDNTRRRRGGGDQPRASRSQACYVCGKTGHFAKACRQNKERESERRRSRSSQEKRKKRSKKHRHRSSSSESSRTPKQKRKDKKQKSRKIKKSKHKKSRKNSDSDSS